MNEPTVGEALRAAERRLGGTDSLADAGSARLDAEVLLAACLAVPRAQLYARPERRLASSAYERFDALVRARCTGTPVPYLTGRAAFHAIELAVGPAVLVPRPETELLVETALEQLAPDSAARVADLGTGSGAIAAALGSARPRLELVASDRCAAALALARRNFERLHLEAVRLVMADWLAPFAAATFDVIVSNPPYVSERERGTLGAGVDSEPSGALYAGPDGLDALRVLVAEAPRCLVEGGWLAVEHGAAQGEAVRVLFNGAGFVRVTTHRDLAGHERVTEGRHP